MSGLLPYSAQRSVDVVRTPAPVAVCEWFGFDQSSNACAESMQRGRFSKRDVRDDFFEAP
jgi:hypothetical protein